MGLDKSTALATGSGTLRKNLPAAMAIVPLQKDGFFGDKGKRLRKGSNVRVHRSSQPLKDAFAFQAHLSAGAVIHRTIPGKGHYSVLRDGTTITFRSFSTSDGSPVVEVRVSSLNRIKNQKIHFVQKGVAR